MLNIIAKIGASIGILAGVIFGINNFATDQTKNVGDSGTINSLPQFMATTSPYVAVTPRTYGKKIYTPEEIIANYFTAILANATSTFAGGVTFGNGLFYQGSTGRLSLGADEQQMTVNGGVFPSAFSVHTEGSSLFPAIEAHSHSDNAAGGAIVYGARSRGTESAETVVQNGDNLFDIYGTGYDGTDYALSSAIEMEVDGTPGTNDMPGRIKFSTSPDGSQTLAERMRITNAGFIGIGTSTPLGLLHVGGSTASHQGFTIFDDNGATDPQSRMYRWRESGDLYHAWRTKVDATGNYILSFAQPTNPTVSESYTDMFKIGSTGTITLAASPSINTASGNITIGTNTIVNGNLTASAGILQQSGTTSGTLLAITGTSNSTVSGQQQLVQIQASATPNSGTGTVGAFYGMIFLPQIANSSNNITTLSAIYSRVDTAATYSGIIGTYNGFVASNPVVSGGTITNRIGLNSQIITSGTGSYNIYAQGTAQNWFRGNVGIGAGVATPSSILTVRGAGTGTARTYEFSNSSAVVNASLLDDGTAYFKGNLGVGTTTPWANLSVGGILGNQNNLFNVSSTTASGTYLSMFNIAPSGNISIGALENTTNIDGTSYNNGITLHSLGSGATDQGDIVAEHHSSVATIGGNLGLMRTRGIEGTETIVQNGDVLGEINILGYNGANYSNSSRILGGVDGTPSSTAMPGFLSFLTTPASTVTPLERFRITSAGLFGFGTTTPASQSRITINGGIGTDGAIPTISACGTSPVTTVGSTDTAGVVTEGTVATGCTITFAVAKTRAPFCVVESDSGLSFSKTVSATAITITNIGALSSTALTYQCINNDL